MAYKCDLCNLDFSHETQFKEHVDGKKHKRLEEIKEEREKSALKSVFVSGLKKDIFVKHIEEHFEKFGKINKIVIDKDKNAYAIVEFENEASVESVLAQERHEIAGKHVKVKRREMKEFVSRIPNKAEKKKELLEKCKEEALAVNKILDHCDSFDNQIDKLIAYLKLKPEDLRQRELVCDSLNQVFKKFWPNECQVSLFGSTSTGLACHGSDMDMTVFFSRYLLDNRLKQQILPKIKQSDNGKKKRLSHDSATTSSASNTVEEELNEDIDFEENDDEELVEDEDEEHQQAHLKEALKRFFNEGKHDEFLTLDLELQVKIVARIIQRFTTNITSVRTITNTRCPVVRFYHDKAKINCDLSINNFFARENTRLINLYMKMLDPLLEKLIFVVRYWMKQKNLHSASRFNSYTIIWMIIFYLQKQSAAGTIPTVQDLAQMTNLVLEIHGYNCSFETNLDLIRAKFPTLSLWTSSQCLRELIKGFFDFYVSLFGNNDNSKAFMISTRTATIVWDLELLSKESPYINVQDPFDMSHNISGNVSKHTLERFVHECKSSSELLAQPNHAKKSASKSWGLMLLMTRKTPPTTLPTLTGLSLKDEQPHAAASLALGNNQEELSVRKAVEFVLFLFKECLLFEQLPDTAAKKRHHPLNRLDDDDEEALGSPKRLKINTTTNAYVCVMIDGEKKLEEQTNVHAQKQEVASYHMRVSKNTWLGRRSAKRELQKQHEENELELEKQTSAKLAAEQNTSAPIDFRMTIYIVTTNDVSNLQIEFDLLNKGKDHQDLVNFANLVHFLNIYINNSYPKLFPAWNK